MENESFEQSGKEDLRAQEIFSIQQEAREALEGMERYKAAKKVGLRQNPLLQKE